MGACPAARPWAGPPPYGCCTPRIRSGVTGMADLVCVGGEVRISYVCEKASVVSILVVVVVPPVMMLSKRGLEV